MPHTLCSSVMNGSVLLDGTELYDAIMDEIEPDLLSGNLERTKQWLREALPEERAEMTARFTEAFKEYDARMGEFEKDWLKQFAAHKRTGMKSLEQKMQAGEDQDITALESKFSDPQH